MTTLAHVITSGEEQIVQLPKDIQIDSPVLEISRRGEEIVLRVPEKEKDARPKEGNIAKAVELLRSLPDDFMIDRYHEMQAQGKI